MADANEQSPYHQIAQKVVPGSQLLHTWTLDGGISANMTALELLLPDGQRTKMIVRRHGKRASQRNPHAAADEFRILQAVRQTGVTAQQPYLLDESGEILPDPYLVIEYIEGQPEFAPTNLTSCVEQIATQLAAIHRVTASGFDLSFLPQQAERFARAFQTRPPLLDHSLEEERIRACLEAVWPLPQQPQPTLLHGDFWPGNLLWREGKLVAVIDWEDAEVGNPLVDVAITRLDMLWTWGIEAMHIFTEAYQSQTSLDFSTLPYWDLFAALRPMLRIDEMAAVWPSLGRSDVTPQTMRAGHHWFVDQAFAQISRD